MSRRRREDLCVLCGKVTAKSNRISHRNTKLFDGFVFCADCVRGQAEKDETPHDLLRMLNIPYVDSMWSLAEEADAKSAFSEYLKIMGPRKNQYPTYQDSEFNSKSSKSGFKVTDEMIGRWGTLSDIEDYIDLEMSYQDLKRLKPPSSSLEDRQYVETVRIGQRLREEITVGKASDIKSLKTAHADSLRDIGLDNTSLYNRDSDEGIGVHIQKFENTEPLPDIAPEFQDVDRIMDYIRILFTNPMKRVHGVADNNEIAEINNLRSSIIPRRGDEEE